MPEEVYTGVYLQLSHSADLLNDGYYRYRQGELTSITHLNGEIENIDPWQNAGTVALQNYFFALSWTVRNITRDWSGRFAKTYAGNVWRPMARAEYGYAAGQPD